MQVEAYFSKLGSLGAGAIATDRDGKEMPLDEGMARFLEMYQALPGKDCKAMIIGNGGSSAIASHFATDFTKNGHIPTQVFSDAAIITCLSNDLGYENVYAFQVDSYGRSGDLLIAISSSGTSKNILKAVEAARAKGADVVTMSGFKADNPLRQMGDLNIYVPIEHYGFVECAHFVQLHVIIDAVMNLWPEKG